MEDIIKMRYGFAMCAFARMYGVVAVNGSESLHRFCKKWAESDEQTPTGTLTEVNFYFKDRWDTWGDVYEQKTWNHERRGKIRAKRVAQKLT